MDSAGRHRGLDSLFKVKSCSGCHHYRALCFHKMNLENPDIKHHFDPATVSFVLEKFIFSFSYSLTCVYEFMTLNIFNILPRIQAWSYSSDRQILKHLYFISIISKSISKGFMRLACTLYVKYRRKIKLIQPLLKARYRCCQVE